MRIFAGLVAAAFLLAQPASALTFSTDYDFDIPTPTGSGSIDATTPADEDSGDTAGTVAVNGVLAELSGQVSAGSAAGVASFEGLAFIFIANPVDAADATLHFLYEYELGATAFGEVPSSSAGANTGLFDETQGAFIFNPPFLNAAFPDGESVSDVDALAFSRTIGAGETLELALFANASAFVSSDGSADSSGSSLARLTVTSIEVGTVAPIPLPAAAWMLLAGLGALGVAARRRA